MKNFLLIKNSSPTFLTIMFGILLLVGMGCMTKKINSKNILETATSTSVSVTTTTIQSEVSPFEGGWVFSGPTEYGDQDSFNLSLHLVGTSVTGTFSAVLSPNARRIDTGNFVGTYDAKNQIISGHWTGDRGDGETIKDEGEALLQWDFKMNTISWLNVPGSQVAVNDYSLPKKVTLWRDPTEVLSVAEQQDLVTTVQTYVSEHSHIKNCSVQIVRVAGDFALTQVAAPESEEADLAYVYVQRKRNGVNWFVVLGPGTQFDHGEFERLGIPGVLWVN